MMTDEKQVPEAASWFDRKLLDKGSKLYLKTVDGKDSGDWVRVLSRWSDPVRFELDDTEREGLRIVAREGDLPTEKRAELLRRCHLKMIVGWGGPGFDGIEFTEENVDAWLRDNPQHAEAVDNRSGADRFFTKARSGSSSGSDTSDG
jgi:hypothetical protein